MLEERVGVVETFMSLGRMVPDMAAAGMRRGRAQCDAMLALGALEDRAAVAGRSACWPWGTLFARCGGREQRTRATEAAAPLAERRKGVASIDTGGDRWARDARGVRRGLR